MAEISAKTVNELRKMTGLGLMECKALLQEAGGDIAQAATLAQEKGKIRAAGRAGRAANAGRLEVALAPSGQAGAMIELNCETDFVARNDDFRKAARDLAEHVLALGTDDLETVLGSTPKAWGKSVRDALVDLNARTGENVTLSRVACFSGAGQVDSYVHHNGLSGALVQLSGPAEPALVKDIAMQVVAAKPLGVRREDMPADVVAEQKRIFLKQVADQMADKPEQIREKIATGKLDAWYREHTLLEQEFVKDPSKKVKDVLAAAGKDIAITRFARFVVGEAEPETQA
jgi:elongation factor Ts